MSALFQYTPQEEETSPLHVAQDDMRVFNVRYMPFTNLITVVGWSITEDVWLQYCQILADMERHLRSNQELIIYFKLELFNTSSAKYLFKVIKRLNQAHAEGKDVKVYWSSAASENKEEIREAGLDMAAFCDFPFQNSCA